jgi:hypothetical protein
MNSSEARFKIKFETLLDNNVSFLLLVNPLPCVSKAWTCGLVVATVSADLASSPPVLFAWVPHDYFIKYCSVPAIGDGM